MKQIYDFTAYDPPPLSAGALEQARKRRSLERQILLLSIAALLLEFCAIGAALFLGGVSALYGMVCAAAIGVLNAGGGLITLALFRNKDTLTSIRRLYHGWS